MKLQALCRRTTWEIVRDPLNLAFGLGFPLVLLLLLSAIQANVPVDLFAIDRLTPGISVFGLAFIALFSATLVARDRESALLQRLYTAPLTAGDFIFGYVLPLAPMAAVQAAVCYLAAIPLGLTVSVRMIWAVLLDLPAALLFIGLGLAVGYLVRPGAGGRGLPAHRLCAALCPRRGAGPGGSVRRLGQRHAPLVVGAGLRRRGPGCRRAAVPAADEAAIIWIEKTGAGRDARHRFCSNLMQSGSQHFSVMMPKRSRMA